MNRRLRSLDIFLKCGGGGDEIVPFEPKKALMIRKLRNLI